MAKSRAPEMSMAGWLALARSPEVLNRLNNHDGLDDFQAILRAVARRDKLDWEEAVAFLHMVYAWMPTMLRPTEPHTAAQKLRLLGALKAAKKGELLDVAQIEKVRLFANRSVVGASKLLHVLNPSNYPIWDSRVAQVFLWSGVSPQTYSTLNRYVEYVATLRKWVKDPAVKRQCKAMRGQHPAFAHASDLRLVEVVLFRGKE